MRGIRNIRCQAALVAMVVVAAMLTVACSSEQPETRASQARSSTTAPDNPSSTVANDPTQGASDEPAEGQSLTVRSQLAAEGTVQVSETIVVTFPAGRHGLERSFRSTDSGKVPVDNLTVATDGQPAPWEWVQSVGQDPTARIGNPNVTLAPGMHTYDLTYTTTVQGEQKADGSTSWAWDAVGDGWRFGFSTVKVSALFPGDPTQAACNRTDDAPCTAKIDGRTVIATARELPPSTGLTLSAKVPV